MSFKDVNSPVNFLSKESSNQVPIVRRDDFARRVFPITYYHLSMNDNDTLKELLVDKIVKDSENLPIPEGWTTNCLRTSFDGEPRGKEIFFGEDETYQKVLEKRYGACINAIFDAAYKVDIDEIWYNVYVNGEYQEEHDHLGSIGGAHFSCIHFLSFDRENHQPVVFRDPLRQLRNLSLELDRNKYDDHWIPDVAEGDLLMFPSYLSHEVKPGKPTPDYPRVSIAFNFKVLYYNKKEYA